MTKTSNIDTKNAVRKFLERQVFIDREDPSQDPSDEISAVLDSIALSFLLSPQTALFFIYKAKNTAQQIVKAEIEILDYMISTISEINYPDDPITDISDLIEAQTALVEINRLERVVSGGVSYDRYVKAISRFLDQLAKSVKRGNKGEFERTGTEAKQDLFRSLEAFSQIHSLMQEKITALSTSVKDFRNVDLTKITSSRTIPKVRSSLKKVIQANQLRQISKTSMAIELLAGASALQSISNENDIFDPIIETNKLPKNRSVGFRSESSSAVAIGSSNLINLSSLAVPWTFDITVNPLDVGVTTSVPIPVSGASGRAFIISDAVQSYTINPSNKTLYIRFDGITPPTNQPVMIREIELPTGAVTITSILAALNHVSTGLIDGTAVELYPGTNKIVIYGSSLVTKISIVSSIAGAFDLSGNYIPSKGSAHSSIGFGDEQTSNSIGIFSIEDMVEILSPSIVGASVGFQDGSLRIASLSEGPKSSLLFTSEEAFLSGFSSDIYESFPSYIELVENGQTIDPTTLGIVPGNSISVIDDLSSSVRNVTSDIVSIDGTRIFIDSSILPRSEFGFIKIYTSFIPAIQNLLNGLQRLPSFSEDILIIELSLTPLLSGPTLAKINDALSSLSSIRAKLSSLLSVLENTFIDEDSAVSQIGSKIIFSLESRGLDRALELLLSGQFVNFFSLTKDNSSKASAFLKTTEEVGRNDLASTIIEQDIDDLIPKGTTPDDDILTGEEILDGEVL